MFLIYAILFLFFIYCKIFINYKNEGLKKLIPRLIGTKMPHLMPLPLKTLLLKTMKRVALAHSK